MGEWVWVFVVICVGVLIYEVDDCCFGVVEVVLDDVECDE